MPRPTKDAPQAVLMCIGIGGTTYANSATHHLTLLLTHFQRHPHDHLPPLLHPQPGEDPLHDNWPTAHRAHLPIDRQQSRRHRSCMRSHRLLHQRHNRQRCIREPTPLGHGPRRRGAIFKSGAHSFSTSQTNDPPLLNDDHHSGSPTSTPASTSLSTPS